MMRSRRRMALALGVGLCVTSTVAVLAAPFLPDRGALPARFHAARELERTYVTIAQISSALEDEGVTRQQITRLWEDRLRDAGIAIAPAGEDAPTVVLSLKLVNHDKHEDVVGYGLFMTLDQRVHVDRLDTTMVIPTYVNNLAGITDRDKLKEEFEEASLFMIKRFLKHVHMSAEKE